MHPNQQVQVKTEVLRQILEQDARSLKTKLCLLKDRRNALLKILEATLESKATRTDLPKEIASAFCLMEALIKHPGVRELLGTYIGEASIETGLMKHQLEIVESRLRELGGSIIIPRNSSGLDS